MTRPRKQTVDWFPHSCDHGMTMYVLDKRYGIAGYYFWFRLLELLGNTEGHFIDAENLAKFEYLQAYTHTDGSTCNEILDLLATLEAIDPTLWKERLIWSDNFVKGLAALYRNRNLPPPVRPDNYRKKPGSSGKIGVDNRRGREGEEGEEGEEKKTLVAGKPATLTFTPQNLAVLWNEKAPPEMARVNLPFKRSPKAMEKIKDALKRNPDPEWWAGVIWRMFNSPFLRGEKGWKADLDFMVRKAEEIVDGKYDGGKPAQPKSWGALAESIERRKENA